MPSVCPSRAIVVSVSLSVTYMRDNFFRIMWTDVYSLQASQILQYNELVDGF